MPGNTGERRPGGNNPEFRRFKPVEFQEYNGWVNFPSWDVFTVMTSYYETSYMLQTMASHPIGGRGAVRRAVLGIVDHWKNNKPTPHPEAARVLVQDFLMNGVRKVEWTPVLNTLRGEPNALDEANELTGLTSQLLSGTDWKPIVAGAQHLYLADNLLRSWMEEQCLTWVASPEARKHTGSVGRFANTVLDIYFQAVQWEKVTNAFRGK